MTTWTGTLPSWGVRPIPAADLKTMVDALAALTDAWTSFTPTWTSTGTQPALGNGVISGQYLRAGKLVIYRGRLDMGSTTTFGTGIYNFSLPVAFNTSGSNVGVAFVSDATGNPGPAAAGLFGSILFLMSSSGNVTATSPFTWAVNDNLGWTLLYEST